MDYQRTPILKPVVFAVILVTYLAPRPAAAGLGVECALVEDDMVQVDGLLDDWSGIEAATSGAFGMRCAQTSKHLFLVVSVEDKTVIRTSARANDTKQDRLTLSIGALGRWSKLVVAPGTRGYEPIHTWRGKRAGDDLVADAMQSSGWAVEAALPLAQLAGWGRGTPKLAFQIEYRDRREGSRVEKVSLAGTIRFAGATAVYRGFMQQTRLSRKDVRVDTLADLDGVAGVERVIIGGKFVGVINDEYRFLTLPVQSARDLIVAKVADLGGDGQSSVITQYREHGNGGSRDVLAVWNLQPNGSFARSLAIEVRKQVGGNVLENDWELRPRAVAGAKKKRKKKRGKRAKAGGPTKGYELVVRAGKVTGWDEDSYDDVPPEDMRPILMPWAEQTSSVFYFEGDQVYGGEPLDAD